MGLFDNLRSSTETDLSPRAAMLLACISMIGADGFVEDDELAIVIRIDGGARTPAWDQALLAWRQVPSPQECVALVTARLDYEQRRFTLANLVDIAMADGFLEGEERNLLQAYLVAFGLEPSFVDAVGEVIGTKNNRNLFNS